MNTSVRATATSPGYRVETDSLDAEQIAALPDEALSDYVRMRGVLELVPGGPPMMLGGGATMAFERISIDHAKMVRAALYPGTSFDVPAG